LHSARVFQDRRDEYTSRNENGAKRAGANPRENRRSIDGGLQPSKRVAPVWPTSKPCKGGPAAPAFGG
jgi:hypothetical protein